MGLTEKKLNADGQARLFDFDLGKAGWGTIIFNFEDKSFEYSVSYLSNPVEDIIDALWMFIFNNALLTDQYKNKIQFSFTDEVSDYTVVLHGSEEDVLFDVELLEKRGVEETSVYQGRVAFREFGRDVLESVAKILSKHGFTGFRYSWDDMGTEFPISKFIELYDWLENYHDKFDKQELNFREELEFLQRFVQDEDSQRDLRYYLENGSLNELEKFISEHNKNNRFRQELSQNIIAMCNHYSFLLINTKEELRFEFEMRNLPRLEEQFLLMLENGADIHVVDNYDHSLLRFATKIHSYRVCEKLLELDRKMVNHPNSWGETAIFCLPRIKDQSHNSNEFRIFDLFLRYGADLYHIAANKVTPLDLIEANDKYHHNGLLDYVKTHYPALLKVNGKVERG